MKHVFEIGGPAALCPQRLRVTGTVLGLSALLALGGCAGGGGWSLGRQGAAPATAAAAAAPSDPLLAFAARAQPGDRESLTLAGGQPATVRLVRAYHAASGRECREIAVGTGMAERSRLVCGSDGGGWAESRPLLPGGGVGRP
jgi:hypothetical protein